MRPGVRFRKERLGRSPRRKSDCEPAFTVWVAADVYRLVRGLVVLALLMVGGCLLTVLLH